MSLIISSVRQSKSVIDHTGHEKGAVNAPLTLNRSFLNYWPEVKAEEGGCFAQLAVVGMAGYGDRRQAVFCQNQTVKQNHLADENDLMLRVGLYCAQLCQRPDKSIPPAALD